MKLTDTMNKTMNEILAKCDIIDQKIHSDEYGNIKSIEIKYVPQKQDTSQDRVEIPTLIRRY